MKKVPPDEDDFEELFSGLSGVMSFAEAFNKRRRHTGGAGGAAAILLSANSSSSSAVVGDLVGLFSVIGGTGVYTFSLLFNPGGLFQINGSRLEVGATLSGGIDSIIVQASNGAGSIVLGGFSISVASVSSYVPTYELLGF